MRLLPTTAVLLLLTLAAACGEASPDQPTAQDPGVESAPTEPSPSMQPAPDDVVLDVTTAGGYTSPEYQFSIRPSLRVYGDGRALRSYDEDPGQLLTLSEVAGTDEQRDEVLALAQDAGLLAEPPDYELPADQMVTDMPSTTVTLTADGQTWTHSAYALSFAPGSSPARDTLAKFISDVGGVYADDPGQDYMPTHLRLDVADLGRRVDEPDVDVVPWAGPEPLEASDCVVVEATPELLTSLSGAPTGQAFLSRNRVYAVTGAALLPDERPATACDDWTR